MHISEIKDIPLCLQLKIFQQIKSQTLFRVNTSSGKSKRMLQPGHLFFFKELLSVLSVFVYPMENIWFWHVYGG